MSITKISDRERELQARVDALRNELAEAKNNYLGACKTVALMHETATGRKGEAPWIGVVEDIAVVRNDAARAGWVMVPLEPTQEMLEAAIESSQYPDTDTWEHYYKAMIAAAKGTT